jgi:glycosyltransferase involved in cell wall biosynthesis
VTSSVLFLLRSMRAGGAERQLVTLAMGLRARGRRVHVVTFYPDGELVPELAAAGVPLTSLNKRGRWDLATVSFRLVHLIRRERPQVLHPYLPDPNLLTALLRPVLPRLRLVWGVRAAYMDLSNYDWVARASNWTAAALSRQADAIIVNSRAGELYLRTQGYPADRLHVVPNGIDTAYFRHDPGGQERVRAEWGVTPATPLIGLVARIDPIKDHGTFLRAAAHLAKRRPDVRFVCVGAGSVANERDLREQISSLGLGDRVRWAGGRSDMPAVYSALDIATSTSIGEGFPNAVAEAMACGTPCVVTDVGDSAWIVDGLGEVVPPSAPVAVADAWERVLANDDRRVRRTQRERIVSEFSVERLVSRTEQLLWNVAELS